MKHARHLVLIILMIAAGMSSCSKDISVGNADGAKNRNVAMDVFITFNGNAFSKDSIYFDAAGNPFVIDDFRMIISNFFVEDMGDTITDTTAFAVIQPGIVSYELLDLPAGSYSGSYGFTIGLDEQDNAKVPNQFPASSGLRDPELYRGATGLYSGYRFVLIVGRAFDPMKPTETEPSLPFTYELGSTLKVDVRRGKNFTLSNDQRATFDLRLDIGTMMAPFNVIDTETIQSRPNMTSDWANAQLFQSQIDSSLVLF